MVSGNSPQRSRDPQVENLQDAISEAFKIERGVMGKSVEAD